ncbi:MAG: sensor histidine kinase [Candidatus Dormibacteraceae bacterium]
MSLNRSRPHLRGRPWSWITGRPRLVDGFLVAITLLPGIAAPIADWIHHEPAPLIVLSALLVPLQSVPLWWRRRYPLAVLCAVAIPPLIRLSLGLSLNAATTAIVFAVYAVSVYGGSRARLWVGALAVISIIIGVAITLTSFAPTLHSRDYLAFAPQSLVAWVIGDYVRSRRQFFSELVSRHQAAREQAADEERLRIARELHDVVAHNVSVMAIQAGAARVSGSSSAEALQSIETTARDTLSELNRLLGVLRKQPDAPLAPQPGLDQVEALVKTAREAGLEAALKITGDRRPLPAALDLSAFRILQEAITNVLKHANATRVELTIDYQPDSLVLAVSDNGGGATEKVGESAGHGLIGMRERVELFGGELGAGSSSLGGFTIRARLPIS